MILLSSIYFTESIKNARSITCTAIRRKLEHLNSTNLVGIWNRNTCTRVQCIRNVLECKNDQKKARLYNNMFRDMKRSLRDNLIRRSPDRRKLNFRFYLGYHYTIPVHIVKYPIFQWNSHKDRMDIISDMPLAET